MANLRSALRALTTLSGSPSALASLALALTCLTPALTGALAQATRVAVEPQSQPAAAKLTRKTAASQGACTPVAGKLPMDLALRHFVKAAVPLPRRFLIAAGTDSALTDNDMKTLVAEFGPTYYYAGSEASKAKLRDKLTSLGPWPAMLVVKRGDKKVGTTSEVIRLGGHYVTGEFDGRTAIAREYTLACGVDGWVVKEVKEEKGA